MEKSKVFYKNPKDFKLRCRYRDLSGVIFVEDKSFYTRNMIHQYDRQLINGRRIARFRHNMYGSDAIDEDPAAKLAKRKLLVERVAKEIVENVLLAGAENSIVKEVRQRLEAELGSKFTFNFPPSGLGLEIFRETPDGSVPVLRDDKARFLDRLWAITIERVNATML